VAVLIDGEAYFAALAEAIEGARGSILLLGWDFHSAVRLRRGARAEGPGENELVPLLEAAVRRRRGLHVHVLAWDFALLYALERETLPLLRFGVRTHPRLQFATDSAHPVGASQHQKIAVIDDALAFVGGFDLTAHRWDTRAHRPDDPRRRTPDGRSYPPFHDVQMLVEGGAAAALGELARDRWRRATGLEAAPPPAQPAPWPAGVPVAIPDVEVGLARTHPSVDGRPELREVEALYRVSIEAARRWIYVENQYLTADRVARWLAARLEEPDGPEVVIVGPRANEGWLEDSTMGVLRDRIVRRLREADGHGRLRVLYPHHAGLGAGEMINVHAKVMVVDDELLRVGSSNLSNRSLGLDAECDLALEAGGDARIRSAIARVRDDLLAEHLGTSRERVAEAVAQHGSLVRAIDALRGGERSLEPIEPSAPSLPEEAFEVVAAVDPEHPIPLEELVARFERATAGGESRVSLRRVWRSGLAAVLVLALAWGAPAGGAPLAWPPASGALTFGLAALGVMAAVLARVPLAAAAVGCALAAAPLPAFLAAWGGAVAGAAVAHGVGRVAWREAIRDLAARRLPALQSRMTGRPLATGWMLRILPVAPLGIVSLVAGASGIRAGPYLAGTALGLAPGVAIWVGAVALARQMLGGPAGAAWAVSLLALLATVGLGRAAWQALGARRPPASGASGG